MSLLISWLVLSVAVWVTSLIVPGFKIRDGGSAIVVAAVFGVLNALLGWLIFLVLGVVTLGIGFLLAFLTRWVVNAILLKLTDAMTDRLKIESFGTALLSALILSLVGSGLMWFLR